MIGANILIKLSTWANDSINNKTTNENKDEMTGHTFISNSIVSLFTKYQCNEHPKNLPHHAKLNYFYVYQCIMYYSFELNVHNC